MGKNSYLLETKGRFLGVPYRKTYHPSSLGNLAKALGGAEKGWGEARKARKEGHEVEKGAKVWKGWSSTSIYRGKIELVQRRWVGAFVPHTAKLDYGFLKKLV